MEEQLKRK